MHMMMNVLSGHQRNDRLCTFAIDVLDLVLELGHLRADSVISINGIVVVEYTLFEWQEVVVMLLITSLSV